MIASQAVAQRIIRLCGERNLTINGLCVVSGITQSTINDIVNGTTRNPGVATIQKLCDGMNLSLREFFNHELFDGLDPEIQ